MSLPYGEELIPAAHYESGDGEAHVPFVELLDAYSHVRGSRLPPDYTNEPAFDAAYPKDLQPGLYVRRRDIPRYDEAEQLVIVSQYRGTSLRGVPGRNVGVVFGSDEFKVLGRAPLTGIWEVYGRAGRLQRMAEDPEAEPAAQERAAAASRALEAKIHHIDPIRKRLEGEHEVLKSLQNNLNPEWRLRYKVKNLEKRRAHAEELIHEIADIATVNLNVGSLAKAGLHKAIHYNLYGYRSEATVDRRWAEYLFMARNHTWSRLDRVITANKDCEDELAAYRKVAQLPEAA